MPSQLKEKTLKVQIRTRSLDILHEALFCGLPLNYSTLPLIALAHGQIVITIAESVSQWIALWTANLETLVSILAAAGHTLSENLVTNFPPVVIGDVVGSIGRVSKYWLGKYTVQGSYIRRTTVSK